MREGTPIASEFKLTQIFSQNCMETFRPATGKSSVFSLLVRSLAREERISRDHAEDIISKLLDGTHGTRSLTDRVAFPSLVTPYVDHVVGAIGVAPEGIHFEAVNGASIQIVFLTLHPNDSPLAQALLEQTVRSALSSLLDSSNGHESLSPPAIHQRLARFDQVESNVN
ncbi:MAG: PTS sugar transporter subunit IIA [Planctomycetota bacterium]|jgi:mannitol/fructose-specific phosphotransferase system IIA component (Ntr-type)